MPCWCVVVDFCGERSVNKAELIDAVAVAADLSKASAGRALDAMIDAIGSTLKDG